MQEVFVEQSSPKYAGFGRRTLAFIVDTVISLITVFIASVFYAITYYILRQTFENIENTIMWIVVPVQLLFAFVYYPVFESSKLQASPGKMLMRIKVTDIDGNRVSYARALARTLAIKLAMDIFYIGVLMILWTKKKQGLQDIIANCLVLEAA